MWRDQWPATNLPFKMSKKKIIRKTVILIKKNCNWDTEKLFTSHERVHSSTKTGLELTDSDSHQPCPSNHPLLTLKNLRLMGSASRSGVGPTSATFETIGVLLLVRVAEVGPPQVCFFVSKLKPQSFSGTHGGLCHPPNFKKSES